MAEKSTQESAQVATESAPAGSDSATPRGMLGGAGSALGGAVVMRKIQARSERRTDAAEAAVSSVGRQIQRQQRTDTTPDPLTTRLHAAETSHDEVLRNIGVEDRPDTARQAGSSTADGTTNVTEVLPERPHHHATGPVADLRVASHPAVHAAMVDAATKRHAAEHPPHGTTREAAIAAYETAVTTLRNAYLASPLYSSDDTSRRGTTPWAPTANSMRLRDALAELPRFQRDNGGFVKFVVPVNMPPGTATAPNPDVIVGEGAHVEIAQGPVLAAGLLFFTFPTGGGRPTVAEAENTSGGFRPGPMRNALAERLIVAAGYTVSISPNPDGSYGSSPHAARQQQQPANP